jgi:predicted glycoside hydrolase/deacetylase ChbG (UPF0249 family)
VTPPHRRYLIVNADDFGLSEGVNAGVLRAHDEGIVTSASLMVRQPAAPDAAAAAKARPRLSVGLHLDLGEWEFRDGRWATVYEVVTGDDPGAVAAEVERQLESFCRLMARPPTHLDSHQHAHRGEPLRSAAQSLSARLNVPLRHFTPAVRYCGDFYGQGGKGEALPHLIAPAALVRTISSLALGVTELCCHPGDDAALRSAYRDERRVELAALCDPAVRTALRAHSVELISFVDLAAALVPSPLAGEG